MSLTLGRVASLHKSWGSQSWLQPAFSRPLPRLGRRRKSRLKGGCGQECPPHNLCRIRGISKVSDIGLKPVTQGLD